MKERNYSNVSSATLFFSNQQMKRNVASDHEGKKPFKCVFRKYNCSLKTNLNEHISSFHERNHSYVSFAILFF